MASGQSVSLSLLAGAPIAALAAGAAPDAFGAAPGLLPFACALAALPGLRQLETAGPERCS